ncbi:MAG: NAD(P)-binding domain-containing protein [Trebonia sp.]
MTARTKRCRATREGRRHCATWSQAWGRAARAVTSEEAAMLGDLVMVAVPVKAYPLLPAAALAGKLVLDAGNYHPPRDGQLPELDDKSLTSSQRIPATATP